MTGSAPQTLAYTDVLNWRVRVHPIVELASMGFSRFSGLVFIAFLWFCWAEKGESRCDHGLFPRFFSSSACTHFNLRFLRQLEGARLRDPLLCSGVPFMPPPTAEI
jgi:hypothetical protein